MLNLARLTRDAFAAKPRYRSIRIKELEMMQAIATDQYEETQSLLRKAEWQIGEIKTLCR